MSITENQDSFNPKHYHFHLLRLSVARPGMFGIQATEISIR
jgi:hypothetical protein